MTHPDPKAALEEILERHKETGIHVTWCRFCKEEWPCDAARVAKAMLGVVEKVKEDAGCLCQPGGHRASNPDCWVNAIEEALARAAQDLEEKK